MTGKELALHLASGSLAEDAGYLTSADIASVALGLGLDYRLVGGLAVSMLHAAHGSPGDVPPRQTADADVGMDHHIVTSDGLVQGLGELDYVQTEGNRFVKGAGDEARVIDVLVPTVGGR
ncbi:hypothetical protein MWU75_00085 [Ornithinimicrobium sp. F0845]|uniref:hypothetical protein n=1 Tax=Ornithinimicrobium sp. F0845 TaxID=2926412 RepID=UPI001FF504DB|nr:hypothetical protein [Ornithinimicrobium sp. F0845]MCK0110547.1 hypothetical protein [Ornithinimicrobium sp. F0845]